MDIIKLIMLCIGVPTWWNVLGMAVFSFRRKRNEGTFQSSLSDTLLCGAFAAVAVFLFSVWIALRKQENFVFVYKVYGMEMLVLTAVSVLFLMFRKKGREFVTRQLGFFLKKENLRLCIVLAGLYLLIAGTFFLHRPLLEDRFDFPERLSTMAQSNALAGINPLTGVSEETGSVFMMWKNAGLPAFYLWFMRLSRLSLFDVLFKAVPLWVLSLCMCAYWKISAALLGKENRKGRILFMFAFVLITLCGNSAYMNPSYGLLHYAYEETTLISSVLLPAFWAFVLGVTRTRGERTEQKLWKSSNEKSKE